MVDKRNRIIDLKNYLTSLGIDINIGKNGARGHKGIFIGTKSSFRIDISKNLDEDSVLSVLLHEYAHYVHYSYDKTLKSLDFIFGDFSDELKEELIKVTVLEVPKGFALSLYSGKEKLKKDIKKLSSDIKKEFPEFKLSEPCYEIEKGLSGVLKYLLRYDKVKFFNKVYSIDKLDSDCSLTKGQTDYIVLKSKQRYLKRINSRINKLNKYYNSPSELFARFVSLYYTNPDKAKNMAPLSFEKLKNSKLPLLEKVEKIINWDK